MVSVPNGVEILPKILIAGVWRTHERYRQTTDDRRTEDDIAKVNVSLKTATMRFEALSLRRFRGDVLKARNGLPIRVN